LAGALAAGVVDARAAQWRRAGVADSLTAASPQATAQYDPFDESTPAANRAFASLTPDAKVSVIPGASHMPMFENPTAFLTALRWFAGT